MGSSFQGMESACKEILGQEALSQPSSSPATTLRRVCASGAGARYKDLNMTRFEQKLQYQNIPFADLVHKVFWKVKNNFIKN